MSFVVLDTDVASAVLRGRVPGALATRLTGQSLAVTFVTVGELTKWTLVRHWGSQRLTGMRAFLSGVVVLPYSNAVAVTWGELQARAQLRGRPARPTTPGSRPAAWCAGCRWPRSTSRTSPTSPSTTAYGSWPDANPVDGR